MHKVRFKSLLCMAISVFAIFTSSYNAVLAEEDEPRENSPFRGYSKYKSEFKALCEALEKDGRRQTVFDLIKADQGVNTACYACEPLFQAIETACRAAPIKKVPKKKREKPKKASEEEVTEEEAAEEATPTPTPIPTPIPVYRQRDPNLAVLQSTLAIFSSLAADERTIEATYQAVLYLRSVLLGAENLSLGARDYLETFCEYLLAPYAAYANKLEREERQIKKREEERKRRIDVDALLDF